jgi:type III pantothenate kinase
MIVAIDAGNSALKIAPVRDGAVGAIIRIPTTRSVDRDRLAEALEAAADRPAEADPNTDPATHPDGDPHPNVVIVLVSVVPAWTVAVRELAVASRRELVIADARTIPIAVALDRPDQVGADRLLAAWAAREEFGSPLIVVDLGTATTIDAVNSDGAFAGGVIAPGPELQISALAAGTAQLPPVAIEEPPSVIGRDTIEAIQAGTVTGHVEQVSGLIRRVARELGGTPRELGGTPRELGGTPRELGGTPRVVLTGGGSNASWAHGIEGVDAIDPDLVLRGLGRLAERPVPVGR